MALHPFEKAITPTMRPIAVITPPVIPKAVRINRLFALNPALFRRSSRILNGNGLADLVGTGTRENSAGNRHFPPIVGDKPDNRRVELAAAIFISVERRCR
jgi:hypothetical protein